MPGLGTAKLPFLFLRPIHTLSLHLMESWSNSLVYKKRRKCAVEVDKCQLHRVWNHLGDESLGMPVGDFLHYVH